MIAAELRILRRQLRRLWKSYVFYVENGYPTNASDCLRAIHVVERQLGVYAARVTTPTPGAE